MAQAYLHKPIYAKLTPHSEQRISERMKLKKEEVLQMLACGAYVPARELYLEFLVVLYDEDAQESFLVILERAKIGETWEVRTVFATHEFGHRRKKHAVIPPLSVKLAKEVRSRYKALPPHFIPTVESDGREVKKQPNFRLFLMLSRNSGQDVTIRNIVTTVRREEYLPFGSLQKYLSANLEKVYPKLDLKVEATYASLILVQKDSQTVIDSIVLKDDDNQSSRTNRSP